MRVFSARSIYVGHIGSVGIYIDVMLIPALAAAYVTGGMEFFLLTLPFFAVHELAHIVAAYLFECRIASFTLMPIGGTIMTANINTAKTFQICAVYAFAPLTNITLFSLFYALGIKNSSVILMQTAYVNGILALFSILPVYPLDGGSIIKILLSTRLDEHKTLSVLLTINIVAGALLMGTAVYCFAVYSHFIWQLAVIAFLFVYSVLHERANSVSYSMSDIINKDARLYGKNVICSNKMYILHNATISCAVKSARHNAFNTFAIIDESFTVYGEFTEKQLLEAAVRYGINAPVSRLLRDR